MTPSAHVDPGDRARGFPVLDNRTFVVKLTRLVRF